jgi:hypothetical protein
MDADFTAAMRAVRAEDLLGTWELVGIHRTAFDTGAVTTPFGTRPRGCLSYGGDGWMNAIFVGDDRPRPRGTGLETDAERAALHGSMCAYAGTYAVEGRCVRHRIAVSWNESWTGTEVVRFAGFDGDGRLVLSTGIAAGIRDGRRGEAVLTWRRPGG